MVTRGGGGSRQTVTNGDKDGRGVKNWDFYGDILFEWPLRMLQISCSTYKHKTPNLLQIIVDSTYIHIYVSKGTKSKDSYLGSLKGYKRNNKITFNLNIVCIQSRFLLATSSRGIKISSK